MADKPLTPEERYELDALYGEPSEEWVEGYIAGRDAARFAAPSDGLDAAALERAFVAVIDRRPLRVEVAYHYGADIPVEHQRQAFLRDVVTEYARVAAPSDEHRVLCCSDGRHGVDAPPDGLDYSTLWPNVPCDAPAYNGPHFHRLQDGTYSDEFTGPHAARFAAPSDGLREALARYRAALRVADPSDVPLKVCPACGDDASHDWWPVGDDSYSCDRAARVAAPSDGLDEAPEWYRRGWAEGHAAALAATEQPETGIDLGPMCRGGTPDGPCDDDFCPGPHGAAAPSDGKPWLVRLTCCGRADGVYAALTWEEADRFRLSYTAPGHYDDVSGLGGGHRRTAIIQDGMAGNR